MEVCNVVLYIFGGVLIGAIISGIFISNYEKHILAQDIVRKACLPRSYYCTTQTYIGMGVVPPWLNDKALIKRYRRITVFFPFLFFGSLILWTLVGSQIVFRWMSCSPN